MNKLIIKNGNLQFLSKILDKPCHGKEARAKNRFLKLIVPRLQEIEKERLELVRQYAEKDKKGEAVVEEYEEEGKQEKRFKILQGNLLKFQNEYNEYLFEDFVIDVLPSNKVDIGIVKEMLDADTTEWNTLEGAIYDTICVAFEEALK